MSKDKDQQIESVLSQEKDTLRGIINSVDNLLEANKQLDASRDLQQKVENLKKEAPSLPWFKRLIHIIPQVKYLFIKNDEEIAEEKRRTNRVVLKHVDNTLRDVGKKNLSLQRIIDTELQEEFNKIITKELSEEQLQRVKRLRESLVKLDISAEKFSQIVPQVYNADEAKALYQERIRLSHLQQDLVKLVKANDNVKELLSIKKELAELREELPSNLLIKKLKQIVVKIKHVFVNTPEQILKDNITHNNEILKRVDQGLEITGKNIEDSTIARTNKLHKELEKLTKRKLSPEQLTAAKDLSSKLESTFAAASVASQPLSTSQDQTKSQAMSSSMPDRIIPTRQAPPRPPYASLQNQAVQQVVESAIPPAPPLMRTTSMPNPTIHQAAENTTTRSLSSSSLPHISLQDSQNIQHGKEAKQTPKSLKYKAPQPPLQNQEVQQAAEPAIPPAPPLPGSIPPAPPLPGQNTTLRQAPPPPTHSVPLQNQDVQQAVGSIPVPPPLPPTANIPPPPPIEGLHAAQRAAGNAMAAPTPPPPPPLPPTINIPPPPPLPQATQQTKGSVPPPPAPPPAVEPTAGQDQKQAAVATPKGQGEERGDLFAQIKTGIQLKKVAPTTAHPAPPSPSGYDHDKATVATQGEGKANFLTEMVLKAKLREEKISESGGNKALEELEKKQKTPPRSPSPLGEDFDKTMAKRYQAWHDDDDEPEHAALVQLIEDKIVDENTLNMLIKKGGVNNDEELIELINDDQIWDDDDREKNRDKVIKHLKEIKENLDRGELAKLPSIPVANVDATKGQFPPKLQSEAKAIAGSLSMTPKDGDKPLAPPPSPKPVSIKKGTESGRA
ncbi:WH2 domain-containing protein [Candidatus Tisiphia endosymbiont of Micropterix aruncella]|uniref:WH2 domain-containing protein n=1 Tax=Candidatus Tisiphia endosymbiont of Micropterix aruncella TaxID=3066271 RepID=UPI003AA98A00